MKSAMSLVALLAIAGASVACAYQYPAQPEPVVVAPDLTPASIRVNASTQPNYLTAVVATVLTKDGNFVVGAFINFQTGAGSVNPAVTLTDTHGSATALVSTPTNTTVIVTSGVLTKAIDITGAVAPAPPTTTPIPPPPLPPPPTPTAILNVQSTGTVGTPITFGVSAPANGQNWTWTFGDGQTAQTTTFSTTHTYTAVGTYAVGVSAPNVIGANGTITISSSR